MVTDQFKFTQFDQLNLFYHLVLKAFLSFNYLRKYISNTRIEGILGNIKKYFIYLFLFILVSGCYQSSASLMGPAFTFTNTGSIYQTTFNYGLNQFIENTTGKSPIKHTQDLVEKSNDQLAKKQNKIDYIQIDPKKFSNLVKANIEKTKKILSK